MRDLTSTYILVISNNFTLCNVGIFWLLLNYIWPGGKRNWILPQERPTQEIQLLAWGAEMIRDWHVWQGSVWEKNELWVRNGGAYKNIGIVLTNSYWYLVFFFVFCFGFACSFVWLQTIPVYKEDCSTAVPNWEYWKDEVIYHCFSPLKIVSYKNTLGIPGTRNTGS